MKLRPYQAKAADAVMNSFKEHDRVLLVLPTGCGKTIVFSEIARRIMSKGGKVLIVAHREELLDQAQAKAWKMTGLVASVERAASHADPSSLLVVASVQTLGRDERLNEYRPDHFALIIIDEAHHCTAAGYKKIVGYFTGAKVLGVTATPDRSDKKEITEVFQAQAFEYTMIEAVRDGYLVNPIAEMCPVGIDLSSARVSHGDYEAADAAKAIEPVLSEVADTIAQKCRLRRTVVFLPLVKISQAFAQMLRDRGMTAAEVNGESQDRAQVLADFSAGRYQVLCNSMLLTEGWDCPAVDCIVVLRPTKSRALYVQMVGRGMRLSPETGKKDLLILDFLWLTGKHLLCRPSSLFASTDEEAKRMDEAVEKGNGAVDLIPAQERVQRDILAERSKALMEEMAKQRRKKAKLVNPLLFASAIEDFELADYEPVFEWEKEKPTEKQIAALERFGIDAELIDSKGLASKMLDCLIQRRGRASPKQIRKLQQYGFVNVASWSLDQASAMLTQIGDNGWHVPFGIDVKNYIPG